jgi:hypothetical protein
MNLYSIRFWSTRELRRREVDVNVLRSASKGAGSCTLGAGRAGEGTWRDTSHHSAAPSQSSLFVVSRATLPCHRYRLLRSAS